MKSLTNLRNTIPTFFANFVDTKAQGVEIIQVFERKNDFLVLTFDKVDEDYTVAIVDKNFEGDESNAFSMSETYFQSDYEEYQQDLFHTGTFEDYANVMFRSYLGQ